MFKTTNACLRDNEMSPIISGLMNQSTVTRPNNYGSSSVWNNVKGQEMVDLNKFANAIIDECMTAIKQEASISGIQLVQNSEMFAMGLVAANGVIKRRFGIE